MQAKTEVYFRKRLLFFLLNQYLPSRSFFQYDSQKRHEYEV